MTYPLDKIPHFKDARLASYLSDGKRPGNKLGAVLHKGKKKLAFGCNSYMKSHTIQGNGNKQYLHAEISVLLKRRHYEDLESCQITVYRETYDKKPALALPCSQCQKILKLFGIKKIHYSKPEYPFHDTLKL